MLTVDLAGQDEALAVAEGELGQTGSALLTVVHQTSRLELLAGPLGSQVVVSIALDAAVLVVGLAVGQLREGVAVVLDQLLVGTASTADSILVVGRTLGHGGDAVPVYEG